MEIKDINQEIPRIYKKFEGMNDAYVKLVRLYHEIAKAKNNTYSPEYVSECRLNTLEGITVLKREYVNAAIKVIDQIREEYGEKRPEVEEPKTDQAKLLRELQRSNNLALWKMKMEVAAVNDLRAMYKENKWDEDFKALLDVELKRRANQPEASLLKHEIENPPKNPAFREIDKIEKGLKSLVTMNYYPESVAEKGLDDLNLRNITNDLDTVMDSPAFHL